MHRLPVSQWGPLAVWASGQQFISVTEMQSEDKELNRLYEQDNLPPSEVWCDAMLTRAEKIRMV